MKEKFKNIWIKLKNPPLWIRLLVYFVTILCAGLAIFLAASNFSTLPLQLLTYASYLLSAVMLSYSVILIIHFAPKLKQSLVSKADKHTFSRQLLHDFGFRTIVFAIGSFVMSFLFGIFNGIMGIHFQSVWYGALAGYYIFLAILRGMILFNHKKLQKKNLANQATDLELSQSKTYLASGIVLLALNLAMSSAVVQMIVKGAAFSYVGLTIYAYAAYAFYKITLSIINLVRAKKQDNLSVQALRNANLADAAMSILALQTALLTTFQNGDVNVSLFNALTGSAVCLITISLGIFMIVKATKIIKNNKQKQES